MYKYVHKNYYQRVRESTIFMDFYLLEITKNVIEFA